MDTLSDYEIFLRNGTSFTLTNVRRLDIGPDKLCSSLKIVGSEVKDALIYLDVTEIVCIVKRNEYPKTHKWWKWW